MRIALVANSFPVLSETFIYNHAAGLAARGLDVTVVVGSPQNDAAMFEQFDGRRYGGPVRELALTRSVSRTAREVTRRLFTSPGVIAVLDDAHRRYGKTPRALRAALIAISLAGFDADE